MLPHRMLLPLGQCNLKPPVLKYILAPGSSSQR